MQKTHVVMLLDESSSMEPHRSKVVSTFNEYVKGLTQGRVWISLFKFAGKMWGGSGQMEKGILSKVFENRKAKDVYDLTKDQYSPLGNTPLYDAIGSLIKRTKKRLPKEAKVLFVIHTDGQENTSREHNQETVKRLIAKCEKKRGWTFVYLGEGAQAWNAGYDFGIENVANFSSSMRGAAMDKLAGGTMCYASSASVGGAAGSTQTFYADANLTADDIDPAETPHVTSTVQTSEKTAEADDS